MRTALALVALLLILPSASAVYVETPLRLRADKPHAEVGDEIVVTIEPSNESVAAQHATRTLLAIYSYDSGQDGEAARGEIGNVTLDANASGTLRWTVPAEVQDKNVWITLLDGEETLGSVHVGVGEAPPIMMATGGAPSGGAVGGESPGEPVGGDAEPAPVDDGADDAGAEGGLAETSQETPGLALPALLAAVALALVALRRR